MAGYSDLWRNVDTRPFISEAGRTYSYADVKARVSDRVAQMNDVGGAVVAVTPDNSVSAVFDCLAVWESGRILQLVNGRLTPAEVRPQVERTHASVLGGGEIQPSTSSAGSTGGAIADAGRAATSDVALIVATSGSTGAPKLVELTWDNLLASAEASRRHLDHNEHDRWLAVLPLFHIGGFSIITRSMLVGGAVELHDRFEPARVAAALRDVTLASLVGAMLPPILEVDPGPYTGVRAVLVGGGPTPQPVLEAAAGAGMPVLSTYGMTETSSQIATSPLGDGPHRRARPLPGAEIRISPAGEIEVRGAMVSTRVVGEPPRDPTDWLATGDMGVIDAEGFLRVEGRREDLIISGGENVMPAEVEAAIEAVDGVQEAAVLGVPDERWGQQVAVAIVTDVPIDEVAQEARRRLAGYKLPKRWVQLAELPRTSLGKIDRVALRQLVEDARG